MDERIKRLKQTVSLLPSEPGIYRFLNAAGKVIYVGKAKNLRRRVSNYFSGRKDMDAKTRVMVSRIDSIEHVVVASETDALFLENNLIKELQPRYNVMLKDDKTYPWIVVRNEHFPRIMSTRRHDRDGSRYFGPYHSALAQKQMVELIHNLHSVRTCSLALTPEGIEKGKFGVCLEYHIGNCKGPCAGYQSEEEYDANVKMAVDVLDGNIREVTAHLTAEMERAAAELRYEDAAALKQRIDLVRNFRGKTIIVNNADLNLDVFSLIMDEGAGFCNFMRVRSGAVVNSFTVELKVPVEEEPGDILTFAIMQISERMEGALSREVVVPFMPAAEAFPGVKFTVPSRGDKVKLLELSQKNARLYKLERLKYIEKVDPHRHTERIMAAMQRDLYMDVPPRHIECFDNSNIQGTNPVASCVVFRDGKPSRKEYRHFNIKSVVGANDFASMEEVVTRRYSRMLDEGADLPQLVVIDGGKGQLGFAYRVLQKLGLEERIKIVGLAKRLEEVFFPGDPVPHYLDKNSETLKVLMNIRDEAHRFGIAFHRKKRSLNFIKTELRQIPGLGERSVEKLLRKFKTVSKIRSAPPEELAEAVGAARAAAIHDYFTAHNDETISNDLQENTI